MEQRRRRRGTNVLWGSVLLSVAYSGMVLDVLTLTFILVLDGVICVYLCLYI